MAGRDHRRSGHCDGGGTDRSGQAFASAAVPATTRPTDGSLLAQCEIHHEHPKPTTGYSARAGRSDLCTPKLAGGDRPLPAVGLVLAGKRIARRTRSPMPEELRLIPPSPRTPSSTRRDLLAVIYRRQRLALACF